MFPFKKKKGEKKNLKNNYDESNLLKLPELPKLYQEPKKSKNLPSFPRSPIGEEFSRNTIKTAISGGKEDTKIKQKKIENKKNLSPPKKFESEETNKVKDYLPSKSLGNEEFEEDEKDYLPSKSLGNEEFEEDEKDYLPKLFDLPLTKREDKDITKEEIYEKTGSKTTKKRETVFIRIDKFEEGLKLFGKVKEKISEVEKMFNDIKRIKEEEEEELENWKNEINWIKEKIEKLNNDIFSKLE